MTIYKINKKDINKAINIINKKYDDNMVANFHEGNSYNHINVKYNFRLYYRSEDRRGSRIGIISKKDKYACIHAHYDFFNAILEVNGNAVIQLYEDWIIKKIDNKIIGNLLSNNIYNMHKITPSSFLCRCNK